MEAGILVVAFLMEELCDCEDVDKIGFGENELSLASRDSFAIGEEFTPLVVDVVSELIGPLSTCSKGE